MDTRRLALMVALCVVVCMVICLVAQQAHAAPKAVGKKGGDREMATKKGFGALEGGPKKDDPNKPGKLQMVIGFGSIFVMIAVMKWL